MQDPHHAVEHILVGVVGLAVVFVRFLPVSSLELGDKAALLGELRIVVLGSARGAASRLLLLFVLLFLLLLLQMKCRSVRRGLRVRGRTTDAVPK